MRKVQGRPKTCAMTTAVVVSDVEGPAPLSRAPSVERLPKAEAAIPATTGGSRRQGDEDAGGAHALQAREDKCRRTEEEGRRRASTGRCVATN